MEIQVRLQAAQLKTEPRREKRLTTLQLKKIYIYILYIMRLNAC